MPKVFAFLAAAALLLALGFWWLGDGANDADLARLKEKENAQKAETLRPASRASEAAENEPAESAPETPEVVLDDIRQKKIWELEHFTFELEWKFGKKLKDAIKDSDREALLACFLPDATAQLPDPSRSQTEDDKWWTRTSISDGDVIAGDAEAVADYLLAAREPFTSVEKIGLRVLAIDENPDAANHYDLSILVTLKGSQEQSPASLSSNHRLTVEFESDEEIIAGKIIRSWAVDSLTTRKSGESLFAEITADLGLDDLELSDNWKCEPGVQINTYTNQIAVADYDLDGYLDIAISSIQGVQYLLRSDAGKGFEDVTERMGIPIERDLSFTTMATWLDYDNDGYPDLLIGKHLYHNEAGKSFRLTTYEAGLKFPSATMGAAVVDFDNDGWLDLYVLNHMGDSTGKMGFVEDDTTSGSKNELWRNLGNGRFEAVTEQAGIDGDRRHSFSASWFHANDDRYPDLYVVNDFGRNCFFINRGDGSFEDITESASVGDFANSMGVAAGDLNNDGRAEIYVANMFSKMGRRIIQHVSPGDYPEGVYRGIEGACTGSHLYQRVGDDQEYEEISTQKHVNEIGWAYAPVFADFDADGWLDIYATSGFISVNRRKPDG